MTHYTIKDGQIFGYDESQQTLYDQRIANEGHEPISEAGALATLNPPKTLQDLANAAMAQVNAQYTNRMGAIADTYPSHERESWPVQLQEARLVMDYVKTSVSVPDGIETPWVDQCARQRGISREELAARIVVKDIGYRHISGFLSGVRQWHEDCIAMLLDDGEEARQELENYDYAQGWVAEVVEDSSATEAA